jgi:DcaP outer membrane protein
MTRKRTIATLAALGGFTAALTLMSGLPGARADELSELRANNQLLQQRLDQLAAAATAAPVQPGTASLAGSFPRSFLIPGTDTSIAISGFARLNIDWFLSGAAAGNGISGEPNNTIDENGVLLSTPLNVGALCVSAACDENRRLHAQSTGNFGMNVRESRLRVETRTPTAWGPASTVIEFDFAGGSVGKLHVPDSLSPRLRLAYGTLGPWLAGQAYSLFNDLASHATTLDFGGQVGESGTVRPPQLRYTWKTPYPGIEIAGDIEAPDTTLISPTFALDRSGTTTVGGVPVVKNSFPDFVGRIDFHQPWGHLSVRGVLTDDQVNDGRFISRTYLGYGGAISGDVKPMWFGWTKDDITWGFTIGTGMNRYFNSSTAFDLVTNMTHLPTSLAAANAIFVTQASGWEGGVGYEHWWTPTIRSNFSSSIERQEFPSTLLTNFGTLGSCASGLNNCWTANKELITAHVNLVWSPVSFVDAGIEYVYGHRLTNANYEGNVNTIIGQFTVKF